MEVGLTIFIIVALVIAIWIVVQIKHMRHKIFAIVLIALVLFLYVSSTFIFKDQDIDFKTISGVTTASRLYFSWLGSIFVNIKSITTSAIKMDWEGNSTSG